MLNIWPTLPIVVQTRFQAFFSLTRNGEDWKNVDSITAALEEHRDRVCEIALWNPPLEQLPAILHESFPALTRLHLDTECFDYPMLHPDSFLGGSAPHLRSLTLVGITFPEVPKLLLSTKVLVELHLLDVPHPGYISPQALVTCLSSLTSLETFSLEFLSPKSRLDESSRFSPALAHVDLPSLVRLKLHGANDYVEDLVSRINAPRLTHIIISFFYDLQFDVSQFNQFIRRVQNFQVLHQARVKLDNGNICPQFGLFADPTDGTTLGFSISWTELEWVIPSLAVLSSSSSSPYQLSSFERLELWKEYAPPGYWDAAMQNTQWLERFQPFTAVKDLYLGDDLAIPLARTLRQFTGNRATEVLPALQNIFLKRDVVFFEGDGDASLHESLHLEIVLQVIRPFAEARRLSGCPVAVQYWN
jgi:hypothetical protein